MSATSSLAEYVAAQEAESDVRFGTGGTPASILDAHADLLDALDGIELDLVEEKIARWLFTWDQPTLHALASILRKARLPATPIDSARTERSA